MNSKRLVLASLGVTLVLALGNSVFGVPWTISSYFTTSLLIPDNDPTGIADTRLFSMPGATEITHLEVTLHIVGGYNGDYYAYLRHGHFGFSMLLNRVGIDVDPSGFGYPDQGFDVTLSDTATDGDIHWYRALLAPGGGPLTGQWQPDGRNEDPLLVSDSTSQTAVLNSFSGLDPNGPWTLFIADNSALGIGTLTGWGLTVTADVVPETSL